MESVGDLIYCKDAATSRHGLMVCGACNKPITEGEYRVRERPDRLITHHRACTADDPAWTTVDRRRAERASQHEARRQACVEFYAKWGIADLSEYIEVGI